MLQGKGRRNLGLIVALGAALLIFSLPTDASDMDIIHRLFMHHREIVRKVTDTQTGAETMTESDNPEVAQLIQQHVAAMRQRIEGGVNNTLHKWDPLFVSLFEHGHLIHLHVTNTTKGVHVVETAKGENRCALALVQMHAHMVSKFVSEGMGFAMNPHDVPSECPPVNVSRPLESNEGHYRR